MVVGPPAAEFTLHTSPGLQTVLAHMHSPAAHPSVVLVESEHCAALLQPHATGAVGSGSHTSLALANPCVEQFVLQLPQVPLVRSVSHPSSGVGALGWKQLLRLSTQVELHCPFAHERLITFSVPQAREQSPQWSTSAPMFLSQPSPGLPLQSANWLLHTMPQLPERHFGVLFGRPGHTTPQPPQCRVLVCVFTHWPLQFTSGGEHTVVQVPAWHTLPVPHLTPHAPQFALSVWVLVQTLVHLV